MNSHFIYIYVYPMIYILCHTHDIAVVCFRFIHICLTMVVLWSQREQRQLILAKKWKKQKQNHNQTQIHKNKLTGRITKKNKKRTNKAKKKFVCFFPVFWFVFSVCSGYIFSLSLKNMCKTIHSLRSWTPNDSSLTFSLYIIYTYILIYVYNILWYSQCIYIHNVSLDLYPMLYPWYTQYTLSFNTYKKYHNFSMTLLLNYIYIYPDICV